MVRPPLREAPLLRGFRNWCRTSDSLVPRPGTWGRSSRRAAPQPASAAALGEAAGPAGEPMRREREAWLEESAVAVVRPPLQDAPLRQDFRNWCRTSDSPAPWPGTWGRPSRQAAPQPASAAALGETAGPVAEPVRREREARLEESAAVAVRPLLREAPVPWGHPQLMQNFRLSGTAARHLGQILAADGSAAGIGDAGGAGGA